MQVKIFTMRKHEWFTKWTHASFVFLLLKNWFTLHFIHLLIISTSTIMYNLSCWWSNKLAIKWYSGQEQDNIDFQRENWSVHGYKVMKIYWKFQHNPVSGSRNNWYKLLLQNADGWTKLLTSIDDLYFSKCTKS